VYVIHADHLGSTVMLTCYKQGAGCPDRTVIRYFRYDAYGQMKAYDVNGVLVARGNELTDRLYTGQRWDWQAQLYYYGARFYDPRVASFVTEDPVREYANPYAYVGWNPVKFTDPTGMVFGLGGELAALSVGMGLQSAYVKAGYAALLAMRGLGPQPNEGPSTAGSGGNFAGFLASSSAHRAAVIASLLAQQMGSPGDRSLSSAVAQALRHGVDVELSTGGGGSPEATITIEAVNQGIINGIAIGVEDAITPFMGTVLARIGFAEASGGRTSSGLGATGTLATLGASAAIAGTGAVRALAAASEFSHAGSTAVRLGGTIGAAAGLHLLAGGGTGLIVGTAFVFIGGAGVGVAINDGLIAPATGGPTWGDITGWY
jgi:RHS repeat-associated protein